MHSTPDSLAFCNTYNYPAVISDILSEILSTVQSLSQPVISVVLIGSTARGEFSYRIEPDNQVSLWSDLEFWVVQETAPKPADRKQLLDRLQWLETQWGKSSPLFHIDGSYISLTTSRRLPPWIRVYEAKQVGKVLLGKDIRSEMPEIDCDNLDYCELAEVILWRLWAMLLYAPQSWLFPGQKSLLEKEELYRFILCRNALDLTTYLLPWEKVLLSSFRERVKYITEHYAELQCNRYFDPAFPEFLNACLRGKFKFIFPASSQQLYQQTLSYFVQAGNHLLAVNQIDAPEIAMPDKIIKYQSEVFNEFRFRRKVYELMLIKKYFSEKSLFGWWRWYWQGKIGKMVSCLYHLHFALQAIVVTHKPDDVETELNIAADSPRQRRRQHAQHGHHDQHQ